MDPQYVFERLSWLIGGQSLPARAASAIIREQANMLGAQADPDAYRRAASRAQVVARSFGVRL